MQRSWSVSSQQEGSSSSEAGRARLQVKALEGQLRDLHSRLTRLQADTRYSIPSAWLHTVYVLGSTGYPFSTCLGYKLVTPDRAT